MIYVKYDKNNSYNKRINLAIMYPVYYPILEVNYNASFIIIALSKDCNSN